MDLKRSIRTIFASPFLLLALLILGSHPETLTAATPASDQIGVITAVQGAVTLEHPGNFAARQARINDSVLFKDVIETQNESRTKALLTDDTLLTVGEHSRVEITEYIIDPDRKSLLVTVNLVKGKVRALVGKLFTGSGSRFEVHTPSMVAAARGTYYVAWIEGGTSGAANIGTHGRVEVIANGQSVMLHPGQFSLARPTGVTPPAAFSVRAPGIISGAIRGTEVRDAPKLETAREFLAKSGVSETIEFPVVSSSGRASGGNQGLGNGNGGNGGGGNGATPPAPVSGASKGKKEIEHENEEHGRDGRERNSEHEGAREGGDERLANTAEEFKKIVYQAGGDQEEHAKAQAQYEETVAKIDAETQVKVASAQADHSVKVASAEADYQVKVASVNANYMTTAALPGLGQEELAKSAIERDQTLALATEEYLTKVALAEAERVGRISRAKAERSEVVTRAILEQARKIAKAGSQKAPPVGAKPAPFERHPILPSSALVVKPKPIRVPPLPKPPFPKAPGLTTMRGRK